MGIPAACCLRLYDPLFPAQLVRCSLLSSLSYSVCCLHADSSLTFSSSGGNMWSGREGKGCFSVCGSWGWVGDLSSTTPWHTQPISKWARRSQSSVLIQTRSWVSCSFTTSHFFFWFCFFVQLWE